MLAQFERVDGRRVLGPDPERARARSRARPARALRRGEPLPLGVRDPQPPQRQPLDRRVARRARAGDRARACRGPSLRGRDLDLVRLPLRGRGAGRRVLEIAERLAGAGCEEVAFGDTTGMANPRQVGEFFAAARDRLPGVELTAHFHNTRGQGLANVHAALGAGIESFESAFGELGGCPVPPGSTGNISTEDLVSMLEEMGIETGIDLVAPDRGLARGAGVARAPARRPRAHRGAGRTGSDRPGAAMRERCLPRGRRGEGLLADRGAVRRGRRLPQPGRLQALRGPRGDQGPARRGAPGVRGLPLPRPGRERRHRGARCSRPGSATASCRASTSCASASDGRIAEMTVMVRPMSGMHALAERMRELLEARPAPPDGRPRARRPARRRSGRAAGRRRRARRDRDRRLARGLSRDRARAGRPAPPPGGRSGSPNGLPARPRDGSAILAAEVDGEVRGLSPATGRSRDRGAPPREGEIIALYVHPLTLAPRDRTRRWSRPRSTGWRATVTPRRSSGRWPRARATSPSTRRSASRATARPSAGPSFGSPLEVRFRTSLAGRRARRRPVGSAPLVNRPEGSRTRWRSRR